jgi:hypothetical protein
MPVAGRGAGDASLEAEHGRAGAMTKPEQQGLLSDPEHWRRQAAEMRRLAEGSRDDLRTSLLKIAIEYDRIAERAEKRLQAEKAIRGGR